MSGGEQSISPAVSRWFARRTGPAAPVRRRGLFRKYVLALVGLVAVVLLVNVGVEFWSNYRENRAALLRLQQEKADNAALRIEDFVSDIERQIGWTTLPLWDAAPLQQRQFDFVRLLRQVPAITEVQELDNAGREQLKVSRLSINVVGGGADFSHDPAFVGARTQGVWFSSVYFRKQSEPYLTVAMAGAGPNAGVTVAQINLKLIWDVITRLRIGEGGYAYIVDRHGRLIANPDISLVLRETDFSKLPQVAASLAASQNGADGANGVTVALNHGLRQVLTAHAPIEPLGWLVFVEVPLNEAFAPLYASALRDGLWLVLALATAALAGLYLARRMTGPIHAVEAGAVRIGAGDLDYRIALDTGDELESLADQVNDMAARLKASYADLEQKVADRTAELSEALAQQTATAEVLQVINASPGDLHPVFEALLDKAMRLCDAAIGQLAMFDGSRFQTAATRGMQEAFAEYRRRNPPDYGPGTQPARLLAGETLIHIADLKAEEPYLRGESNRRALVDLGGVRTSLMVPLRRDGAVLGFINFYRREVRPFSDKQIALLQNFAAQAVIAMDNARLLNEIRQRQAELRVTFDNMGDGVAMFDAELRLAAWNRNFQQILELDDEFVASRPSLADYVRHLAVCGEYGAGADPEAEVKRLSGMAGMQWSRERTRPDGRVIEVRHNPVPGGGFVLIYGDVTERKRAEAEIRAARDAAEQALAELRTAQRSLLHAQKMAALGQLTAGIAHEIKNPLNFVNNFAGLSIELLDELKESAAPGIAALDDKTRADIDETIKMLTGNLDKIAEHGRRADNIVKSMLEHSRGVSGERREVDLNALVDEALNLAYHGARAQDQSFNITLERDFQPGLAPIEVAPQEMMRVFLNLFSNGFYAAAKQRREGNDPRFKPALKVTTREAGGAVAITVRDNGIGIPPEIRDKLFQPFFTTKPTGEGTGLGLSISYDIISQQHGGTITVDSEPGAYTEFAICLPRRAAAGGAAMSGGI
jgi:signal transduction histidine kinase/HAMP domain-containing protein